MLSYTTLYYCPATTSKVFSQQILDYQATVVLFVKYRVKTRLMISLEILSECWLALYCFFEKLGAELAKKETLLVFTAYGMKLYLETFGMSAQTFALQSSN